jgi:hypothetical protein
MSSMIENEDGINYGVKEPTTVGDLVGIVGAARVETKLVVKVGDQEHTVSSAGIVLNDEGAHSEFVINCV